MSIWINTEKDEALELGQTLACYEAFAEMANAAHGYWSDDYPALSGVLTQCETQEDADPEWLQDVASEAKEFAAQHGHELSQDARNLLANLATLAGQ